MARPQPVTSHRAGAVPRRRRGGGRRRRIKPIKLWREIPLLILIALILALLIKTFLVQAFFIPSQSMQNTLLPGDRVLVNKLSPWFGWQPSRGDVVVFADPNHWLGPTPVTHENAVVGGFKDALTFVGLLPSNDQHDLIKRVIGVPGDQVRCCDPMGRITVDGVPLNEHSYLYPGAAPSIQRFDVKVPAGHIWVMGDNRGDSADSRAHMSEPGDGTVPISDVIGHAFVRIWPLSRIGGLGVPATFDQSALRSSTALGLPAPGDGGALLIGCVVPAAVAFRRRRCRSCGRACSVSGAIREPVRVRCGTIRGRSPSADTTSRDCPGCRWPGHYGT